MIPFCAMLLLAGLATKSWSQDSGDFNMAGREIGTFTNAFGTAATGISAGSLVTISGLAVSLGFIGGMSYSLIYALIGLIGYGLLLTTFIRRSGAQTLAEYFEMRFSGKARTIATVGIIFGMCSGSSGGTLALANILSAFLGLPLIPTVIICFGLIVGFTYMSGLWAVTLTDFIQIGLVMIGIPLMLFSLMHQFGGPAFLAANWPGDSWIMNGINNATISLTSPTYPSVLTIVFLYGIFMTYGGNHYWLRTASLRSEKAAKNSYYLGAFLLIVLIFVPICAFGIYGGALFEEATPSNVFGLLLTKVPPFVCAMALVAVVGASVSTTSTTVMAAMTTATTDVYKRVIKPDASETDMLKAGRVSMLIITVLTIAVMFLPGGVQYIYPVSTAFSAPTALVLLLGAYWKRFNNAGAMTMLVSGTVFSAAFILLNGFKVFTLDVYIHTAVAAVLVMLAIGIPVTLMTKPPYYGRSDWKKNPDAGSREHVSVDSQDIRILDMIYHGQCMMSEITDGMKMTSSEANTRIEKLDRGGLIERAGLCGAAFYQFYISQEGLKCLGSPSGREKELAAAGLRESYLSFLANTSGSRKDLADFMKANGIGSMECSAIITALEREGYLKQTGLFKRRVIITEKGRAAAKEFAVV